MVMYSTNGKDWTGVNNAIEDSEWAYITYADDKFVAVAKTGSQRIVYSYTGVPASNLIFYNENTLQPEHDVNIIRQYGIEPDSNAAKQLGFAELTEQPSYAVSGYELQQDGRYKPLQDLSGELARAEATIERQRDILAAQVKKKN